MAAAGARYAAARRWAVPAQQRRQARQRWSAARRKHGQHHQVVVAVVCEAVGDDPLRQNSTGQPLGLRETHARTFKNRRLRQSVV